ncbi:synaptojanin-2-binding protein [Microcaecilia unicolor]|uniref:Synaptojanin-2-binding protein n=1 Tax=Microcaecilia unicolor TaxID=1415580 RepID=A0A6P7Z4R2_9AMPH|nr:synaptojanin-2-binding protein-like [Microcaecilia unicolor]
MNGGVDYLPDDEEIQLKRGPSGLGFNIVGGTDQQYMCNDSGVYVSKIKDDGAAALDGRLQEGDKIIAVNGQVLKNLLHKEVVDLFINAGEDVRLEVQHKVQTQQNGPSGHKGDGEPGGFSLSTIVVPLLLAGAAATVWLVLKYRHRH